MPFFTYVERLGAALVASAALCLAAPAVLASPAPGGALIRNIATATYLPAGFAQAETASSNDVQARVQDVEALTLTSSQNVARPPGVQVTLSHLLSNTGNVASGYTFTWQNNGAGCAPDTLDLSALRVLHDVNNNGVADPADPVLALGTPNALSLLAGQAASLLVQGTLPMAANGTACLSLVATTALQAQTANNQDTITVSNAAVLTLSKSASYGGVMVPGTSTIDFTVTGNNLGAQAAQPVGTVAPGNTALIVNGAPATLLLVRDAIPAGTQYVAGSLQTAAPGALRLFRLPGDPVFSYRLGGMGTGADDASAIEVAVGLPGAVAPSSSVAMQFKVKSLATLQSDVRNTAYSDYGDGAQPVTSASNTVVIPPAYGRLNASKTASTPVVNYLPGGAPDGTATVRFSVTLRNAGSVPLYSVQAVDAMAGPGATQFGAYTANPVPALNEYTIVAGSLVTVAAGGSVGGTVAAVNPAFNGTTNTPTTANLLAPGALLPVGADATVQFDVRFHTTGRGALINTVQGQASVAPGSTVDVSATASVSVQSQTPALTLAKSVAQPRALGGGVYELDYALTVRNVGSVSAPFVRVVDNLNCTFEMDLATGKIASWTLVGQPVAQNGLLNVASSFTGNAACNRPQLNNPDPFAVPPEVALSLVDGSRDLAPGQAETIKFTVRATEKPANVGSRVALTNKAWAASLAQNVVGGGVLVAAASSSVRSLLIDPQGTVYNALTRQPVAGALVSLRRLACTTGTVGPILPAQINNSAAYTFNADGTVSMLTAADGNWQFFFENPPVTGLCTYGVTVVPPAGSGYVAPSQLIPPTSGSFNSCGLVTPNVLSPQPGQDTTYFTQFTAGTNPDNTACEVLHNHLPLDPGNLSGLVLRKDGSQKTAELGDFIDYALTLTNKTNFPVTGPTFNDKLPAGFAYVAGSARLNGAATPNPAGGAGPTLVFSYPTLVLAADQAVTVRYRLRIGVGAPTTGDAVNRARVSSGPLQSNEASWRVRVKGGVFSDEAFVFGKVHLACSAPGQPGSGLQNDADDLGIPGVRLFMEDGTSVVTDADGKWSLYGLKPITHVLRVDETTLPAGAQLQVLDNRNAKQPASRFVDLKKGELHKANFIVGNCDAPGLREAIQARRQAMVQQSGGKNASADATSLVGVRLDAEGKTAVGGDARGLPAAGQSGVTGITGASGVGTVVPASQALIVLPTAQAESSASAFAAGAGTVAGTGASALGATLGSASGPLKQPLLNSVPAFPDSQSALPLVLPSSVELEAVMPGLNNQAGFIGLKDGDTVASQTVNVRVKGPAGTTLRLTVNGKTLAEQRVGKKAQLPAVSLEAWEYIGVQLQPGANALLLEVVDPAGNPRAQQKINVQAPDKLAVLQLQLPSTAQADGRTPLTVQVRLSDANGVPITARTQITLEADRGRWLSTDLNPNEPGLQAFIEGGSAQFSLQPPTQPGELRVRVSAGTLVQETRMALLPDLRPMIGVGIVEGTLDLSRRGALNLGQMPAGAAFETELSGLANNSDSNARTAARTAFFFKGAIQGDYLLTAAYDSDKTTGERLFRDIRPDEFYPVYGDESVRGFDAQSTQKLYVRIDKNRSYLLYGDFTTASSSEVRQLSQVSRTLTGLKNVYETDTVRATSYVSRTAQTQRVEEFPARGISGPYFLAASNGDLLSNSEKVELLVRDRSQPNVVLQTTALARFVDYTIEPLTSRLLFTRPIASLDGNFNPQSIRVTYEADNGGPKFTVAGTDVQVKVNDRLQLGVVASTDENPENKRQLGALTAVARLGASTTAAAELVATQTDLKGSGTAARLELRHQTDTLSAVAQVAKTSPDFDNPGAAFSAGRTEAVARADYKLTEKTHLRAEALYSEDAQGSLTGPAGVGTSNGKRSGVAVGVQTKLTDTVVAEVGLRHGANSSPTASMFDYSQVSSSNGSLGNAVTSLGASSTASTTGDADVTTVRGRISSQLFNVPQAQVFVEAEQDLKHSDRNLLAVGGQYALTEKTRVYGRYELASSLDGPYGLNSTASRNVGVFGVESNYMEGGRVYNEYRLADSLNGRTGQAAMGVRNTFKVNAEWGLTAGIEHTRALGNTSNNAGNTIAGQGTSTAIVTGAQYASERVKASGIFEARHGDDSRSYLSSMGVSYKVDADWSLLARSIVSDSQGQGANAGNDRLLARYQVGAAYRPVDNDQWNALARYEYKTERVSGTGSAAGAAKASAFSGQGNLPGTYAAHVVSAHVNYNPTRGTYLSGRYAGKVSTADDGLLRSTYWAHLLQGRYTLDLSPDWDLGLQAGVLFGKGGALKKTAGAELGYQAAKNLWLSVGYNFVGLNDPDLTAGEYTNKGLYVRLRFKFDETTLGFAPVTRAATSAAKEP